MSAETSEWEYRYQERLAILIGTLRVPMKREIEIAREEAFKAVEAIAAAEQSEEDKFDLF